MNHPGVPQPTIHSAPHRVRRRQHFCLPWFWQLGLLGLSLAGLLLVAAVALASLTFVKPLTVVPLPSLKTLSAPAGVTSGIGTDIGSPSDKSAK